MLLLDCRPFVCAHARSLNSMKMIALLSTNKQTYKRLCSHTSVSTIIQINEQSALKTEHYSRYLICIIFFSHFAVCFLFLYFVYFTLSSFFCCCCNSCFLILASQFKEDDSLHCIRFNFMMNFYQRFHIICISASLSTLLWVVTILKILSKKRIL